MKKTKLLSIGVFFMYSLFITGCDDDNEDVCERFVSPVCAALDFTVCSDGEKDYLKYNEKDYPCVAEDGEADICDNEADKIIEQTGCVASSASMKSGSESYKSFVLDAVRKIREEALLAAGCN